MVHVGFCPEQQILNFISIVVEDFYEGLEKEKKIRLIYILK